MIDYIVKHTLYTKDDVIDKIESGERDLEDFFLDILDNQNRKKNRGLLHENYNYRTTSKRNSYLNP